MSSYGKSRHALAYLDVFSELARNSVKQFSGEVPYSRQSRELGCLGRR